MVPLKAIRPSTRRWNCQTIDPGSVSDIKKNPKTEFLSETGRARLLDLIALRQKICSLAWAALFFSLHAKCFVYKLCLFYKEKEKNDWMKNKYLILKKIDLRWQIVIDCDQFFFSRPCPSRWRTVAKWNSSISGWPISPLLAKSSENLTWAHDYWLLNAAFFINQTMIEAKREKKSERSLKQKGGKGRKKTGNPDTDDEMKKTKTLNTYTPLMTVIPHH